MEWYHAVILGLVEGITEFLPISSTGHLILTSALLGLGEGESKASLDAFNIVIQGGAILAVLGLYWPRVVQMLCGLLGRDAAGLRLAVNIFVAFVPAAVIGVLLADVIEQRLFYPVPVLSALALGGVVMILIGRWQRRFFHETRTSEDDHRTYVDLETMSWRRALVIGLLQCLAMWPGTSRSLVTIVGGMMVGMKPKDAAEFSFLLGVPTLTGACVYRAAKSMMGNGENMFVAIGTAPILLGIVVAMVSAALAIKWLIAFLTKHGLALFGWYRLSLCAVFAVLIWRGVVEISPDEAVVATPIVTSDE